jgi:hypothetical protein
MRTRAWFVRKVQLRDPFVGTIFRISILDLNFC